jgi:hypothetical protein
MKMEHYLTSRKVEAMLATAMTQKRNTWGIGQEPRWATYLPSPLVLCLALENGWFVSKIELASSHDQNGLVYLVMLKSNSNQPDQHLVLPKNTLVEKMLNGYPRTGIPIQAGSAH